MMHKNTQLAILGNLLEQQLIEIPNSKDVDTFLFHFIKENKNQLLNEKLLKEYEKDFLKKGNSNSSSENEAFLQFIAKDFFDSNKVNTSIEQYLLNISIEKKQYEALKELSIDANNPLYHLIIPNWDGETPKDFMIESWEGIELCKNIEKVIIEGAFVNKKIDFTAFNNLKEILSFSLHEGKLNNLEAVLVLPKLNEIILINTAIPSNKKAKILFENFLSKGNTFIFDRYTIKDIAVLEELKNLNKHVEAREYNQALLILNKLLESENDSIAKMKLLNQKSSIYNYMRSSTTSPEIMNECIQTLQALIPLLDVNREILGEYEYTHKKANGLVDIGYNFYLLNNKEKAAEYYKAGFMCATKPGAGISDYNLGNLIDCLIDLNRKEEIVELLDKFAYLDESNKGWGDAGIKFRWQSLLKHGYFESGFNHLEKYLSNSYNKRIIQDLNNFIPLMNSLIPILDIQGSNASYSNSTLLVKKEDFYNRLCEFIHDVKKSYLKEMTLNDIKNTEKYKEFMELYTI